MSDTVTLKISIPATYRKTSLGRGNGSEHVVQVGRFEGRAKIKSDAVSEIEEQIRKAIESRDLAEIVEVGVAAGEVHVLASRHDGAYEIVRAPLPKPGETSRPTSHGPHMQNRVNAVSIFGDRVEQSEIEYSRARGPALMPDAETALRRLAVSVGVFDEAHVGEVDWAVVAQRVGMVFAEQHQRGALAEREVADARAATDLQIAGSSPEAQALARLLGLRGSLAPGGRVDPAEVRREALAILREGPGERWGPTLADLREGRSVLQTIAAQADDADIVAEIQLQIDNGDLVRDEDLELVMSEREWRAGGRLDKAIAEAIEAGLPEESDKALAKYVEAAVATAIEEERANTADCPECEQVSEALASALGDSFHDTLTPSQIAREVADRLAPKTDRSHRSGCRLEQDENGDDVWTCEAGCPEAVHEEVARLRREIEWLHGDWPSGDTRDLMPAGRVAMALRVAACHVEQGDSLEGSLGWTWDTPGNGLQAFGCYRINNLAGQGGMRFVGQTADTDGGNQGATMGGDLRDVAPAIRCWPATGCVLTGPEGLVLTVDPMTDGGWPAVHIGDVVAWAAAHAPDLLSTTIDAAYRTGQESIRSSVRETADRMQAVLDAWRDDLEVVREELDNRGVLARLPSHVRDIITENT